MALQWDKGTSEWTMRKPFFEMPVLVIGLCQSTMAWKCTEFKLLEVKSFGARKWTKWPLKVSSSLKYFSPEDLIGHNPARFVSSGRQLSIGFGQKDTRGQSFCIHE